MLFSLSTTYLAEICLHFTAHLLCVCCSRSYYCTAHYLPVDRGGQHPCQTAATVDSWVQRAAGLLKMAGAGEPSSLADAPVLYGAVTGEEGRRDYSRQRGIKITQHSEMEHWEPKYNFLLCQNIRKEAELANTLHECLP